MRVDPHGPAGGLQQVDDGRLARQGRDPGLRRAEAPRLGPGIGRNQQGRGRTAPAPHRPGDGLADGRDPPGLRQGARRIGQGLPLIRGLGNDPGVQVDQDAFPGGDHQQQDPDGRQQRLRQRIRDDGAHRTLRAAPDEPRQRPGGHGGQRPEQARVQQQPAVEHPHRLPQVGNARRQHRVPEQDQPGKAQHLDQQDRRRPAVIGDPVPGRERLGHVVDGRQAHEQQEPRAEHHDAPRLVGRRRVRAQRDDGDRPQDQQVLRGGRAIDNQGHRRRRIAHPRQLQRHGTGEPEAATDQHAGRDHATRQIIEPGPAMDPRVLASERPQKGRREQERGNVEGKQEPAVGGQVLEIGRVLLRRRQLQDKGLEHVQRRVGGLEEAIDPQQPGPPVPATGPQQQAGGGGMPDELGRHEDGHLAVLAVVVAPGPRQQQQRDRHLDAGDGDERLDGAADDSAAVGAGRLNGRRRRSRRRAARQHTLDDAQVLDLLAIGVRGKPCASLPLHLLVQRQRVGHVADQIVTVVGAHHSSGIPPRSASPRGRRSASGFVSHLFSYDVWMAGNGQFPHGGLSERTRSRARRRVGRYLPEAGGMTALSRMTARLSALRAASGLGRRSMAASCS